MPPNSLAVVSPTGTAPAVRNRITEVESRDATCSRSTTDASVFGQPSTSVSSLMPSGTPPNGCEMSAAAATARAASASTNENELSSERSIAASVASSSSSGERRRARNSSTSEHASPDHGSAHGQERNRNRAYDARAMVTRHDEPRATALDVRPLTPTIGAEIRGVDCSQPVGDDVIAEIRRLWLRWLVVFFPDQQCTDEPADDVRAALR